MKTMFCPWFQVLLNDEAKFSQQNIDNDKPQWSENIKPKTWSKDYLRISKHIFDREIEFSVIVWSISEIWDIILQNKAINIYEHFTESRSLL